MKSSLFCSKHRIKLIILTSPNLLIVFEMFSSALRRPGSAVRGGSWAVAKMTGGSLPTSMRLFLHLLANALIKLISFTSRGPEKLSDSTLSRTTRTFQFVILAPWWNFTSRMFQLPFWTRGTPLPYVTLGTGSSRPGIMAIWLAIRMLKDWRTDVEGL